MATYEARILKAPGLEIETFEFKGEFVDVVEEISKLLGQHPMWITVEPIKEK